jgi:hypothetical protein
MTRINTIQDVLLFSYVSGLPAIIVLCRGLFGKNVWTLKSRHDPLSCQSVERHKVLDIVIHCSYRMEYRYVF